MLDIIFSPLKAIRKAHKKSMEKTLGVLLVGVLLSIIGTFFLTNKFFFGTSSLLAMVLVAVASVVIVVVEAFILQVFISVLTHKVGFYDALTAKTYGFFVMAAGAAVGYALLAIPTNNLIFSVIFGGIAGILIAFGIGYGAVITLRTAATLFKTDLFTVIVGMVLTYMVVLTAVYLVIIAIMLSMSPMMGPSMIGGGVPLMY